MNEIKAIFTSYEIPFPRVFVTDLELALTNAIDDVFQVDGHYIYRLLCGWHVDHNVVGHAKKFFRVGMNNNDLHPKDQYDSFMTAWREVVKSPFKDEYKKWREDFKKNQPAELV
jgi:hypothetical protein